MNVKSFVVLLAILWLGTAWPVQSGENVWTYMGPRGINAPRGFVFDPVSPNIVYMGTAGGEVYRSTDNGDSWTASSAGLPKDFTVYAMVTDPVTSGVVYAATVVGWTGGVYKSVNGGQLWQKINHGLPDQDATGEGSYVWLAMVVDPTRPETLYVAGDPGVYRSDNGGASWRARKTGLPRLANIYDMVMHPTNTNTLYVAANGSGVYKTTDGGRQWQAMNQGLADLKVSALALQPDQAQTLYAGTFDSGVFKSTNGGRTWQPTGLNAGRIFSLATDPAHPHTLYAGTLANGVLKSTDGGAHWFSVANGLTDAFVLQVSMKGSTLFAGTASIGIFKSSNGGARWHNINRGLPLWPIEHLAITPTALYAGAHSGGIFKSTDQGRHWHAIGLGNRYINALQVMPGEPERLYVAAALATPDFLGGLYKSINDGRRWRLLPVNDDLADFVVDPTNPAILYVAARAQGILKSVDGGENWWPVNTGLPVSGFGDPLPAISLAIDPQVPTTLYVGIDGREGIFKSIDAGMSWQGTGMTDNSFFTIVMDPTDSQILYGGSWPAVASKSSDGGKTWHDITTGLRGEFCEALAFDPVDPRTLYAGTRWSKGIFQPISYGTVSKSTDGGAHWQTFANGLQKQPVKTLVFDPNDPHTLYAGTAGGVAVITFTSPMLADNQTTAADNPLPEHKQQDTENTSFVTPPRAGCQPTVLIVQDDKRTGKFPGACLTQ